MYREKEHFTRLVLETSNRKQVYELPFEDVNGEDMVHALATLMVGMTFSWDTVLSSFADYVADRGYDKYEVIEKDAFVQKEN